MKPRYLYPSDYYADPSANVFNGKLFVYPSHDWEAGAAFDDDGGHFQMKDYHVISMEDVENGEVTDYGKILDVEQVAWAEKQMWDNDVVEKDGKYFLMCGRCRQARGSVHSPGAAHARFLLHRPLRVQG